MHVQKGKDRAVGKSRVVVTNLVFVMSTRRRCFSCVCHAVCRNICVYLSSVTKLNRRDKKMNVNLMRQLWLLLAITLLPLSAVGQRVSYGDMRLSSGGRSLLTSWEAYESSTMNGPSWDVVYEMVKMCEKEFGFPSASQIGDKKFFKVDFFYLGVDSRGRIFELELRASRKAETKKEKARIQKLYRKLKKKRFPPFDRRDIPKARRDSMFFLRYMPCLKHTPREKTNW